MTSKSLSIYRGMERVPLSIIPYVGGKHGLVRNIIPIIMWCAMAYELSGFIEGNAGGARITVNLDPTLFKHRILNDLDLSLCKTYATIADKYLVYDLVARLHHRGYSRKVFEAALQAREHDFKLCIQREYEATSDWVTAAANTYICAFQSLSANMKSFKDFYTLEASIKYFEKVDKLPMFQSILSGVEVTHGDCYDLLTQYRDNPKYFGYFDPSYPPETMRSKNHYKYNMSTEWHEQFSDILRGSRCKLAVSSYESKIYDKLLDDGWNKYLLKLKHVSMGRTGLHVAEFLYCNFELPLELAFQVTAPSKYV